MVSPARGTTPLTLGCVGDCDARIMSQSPGSLDGLRIKREDKPDARYGILPVAVVVGILALIAAAVF